MSYASDYDDFEQTVQGEEHGRSEAKEMDFTPITRESKVSLPKKCQERNGHKHNGALNKDGINDQRKDNQLC